MSYNKAFIYALLVTAALAIADVTMTVTSSIAVNSDDGTEVNRISWHENGVSASENRIGHYYGDEYYLGLRFPMEEFEQGDQVVHARLRFAARSGHLSSRIKLLIEGVLQKNPSTFSAVDRPSQKGPKALAKVIWEIREPWKLGTNAMPLWYASPDISPIINQILKMPDWGIGSEGKSIAITIRCLDANPTESNYLRFRDFSFGDATRKCPVRLETCRTVDEAFEGKALLGRPTDRSITVRVNSRIDTDIYAEYGVVPGVYPFRTRALLNQSGGKAIDVVLDRLQPDTKYFYRLRFRKAGAGPFDSGEEHSFRTRRSKGTSFSFAIQADEHLQGMHMLPEKPNHQLLYKTTLQNMAEAGPDFFISMGDFAHTEFVSGMGRNAATREEALDRYLLQRRYIDDIGHSIPFFLVPGNHEGEQGWHRFEGVEAWDNLAYISVAARKSAIPNPVPDRFYTGNATRVLDVGLVEDYFAWHWGDALFVVLDPYWNTTEKPYSAGVDAWSWTLGKAQYDWLYETLHHSRAKWKFVFIHQLVSSVASGYGKGGIEGAKYKVDHRPSYEWGGEDETGAYVFAQKRPGWSHGAIHDLFVDERVDVVFHGHDHFFGRQELDGIVYLVCPQPGDAGYSMGYKNQGKYLFGDFIENSGHVLVHVNPQNVVIDYVRSYLPGDGVNGEIAYTLTLTDPPKCKKKLHKHRKARHPLRNWKKGR